MSISTDSPRLIRLIRYIHAILGSLFILFLATLLISTFVFTIYLVDGESMVPTLRNKQPVGVVLSYYRVVKVQAGDVVLVQFGDDSSSRLIKRVVAVPGDQVAIGTYEAKLEDDQYFVVGDNQNYSTDSRTFGPISKKQILGKVVVSW